MKTAIFYFSGTGNTKRVAEAWLDALEKEGVSAESFRIEDGGIPDLSPYDRIGIFYPVHAFNAPQIVLEFAEKLPVFPTPKAFFLVMVSGEPLRLNHASDRKLRRILRGRNARTESAWHYVMPYNIIFRHTEEQAWRMDQTMRRLVPLDVRAYFTENSRHTLSTPRGMGWFVAALRVEQRFSHRNGARYRVTGDCTRCGQCAADCPVGNIDLREDGPLFGNRCILCMRCAFSCPENAVRIGWLDSWRVNGPYRFRRPEQPEPETHPRFCRRAYERYYREAQARIQAAGGLQT